MIFDPIEIQLLQQSLRHFLIVIGFFVFAVVLDIAIRSVERTNLASSQLIDGMQSTALFIFRVDQFMLYYMITMATFALMIQFTKGIWRRFI